MPVFDYMSTKWASTGFADVAKLRLTQIRRNVEETAGIMVVEPKRVVSMTKSAVRYGQQRLIWKTHEFHERVTMKVKLVEGRESVTALQSTQKAWHTLWNNMTYTLRRPGWSGAM